MSSLTVEAYDTIFDKSYSFNEIIVIFSEEDSKKVINFDQKNFYRLSCDSVDDFCIESISGYNSNYGKNTVDLFAPGFEIYSTSLNNSYDYYSGTSYAAPFVAGVASSILSIEDYCDTSQIDNLSFSGKDLKYIICNLASYCYGLKDYCKYEGFVNALNAVQLALTYNPIIGYDYYNNLYHEVITRNHSFLEEYDWELSGLSSTFAVNLSPIVLRCSKCNGTSI